jgi:FdhD protein
MDEVDQLELPADACITQRQLYSLINTIRLQESTYKSAGSVHACAMFSLRGDEPEMLLFVEDVGRHNAIDTIAGWLWMSFAASPTTSGAPAPGLAFYTTGRLTSEMVIKSAQMGVPVVVSRSGITQMGHQIAQSVGVCAIGRATNKRFVCYASAERLLLEPGLAQAGAVLGLSS